MKKSLLSKQGIYFFSRIIMVASTPLLALFLLIVFTEIARADASVNDLEVTMPSSNKLFMDSNGFCSPSGVGQGPDGAWYQLRLRNIDGHNQGFKALWIDLTAPSGLVISDTHYYVGNLPAGETRDVFFFVDYHNLRKTLTCSGNNLNGQFNKPVTVTVSTETANKLDKLIDVTSLRLVSAGMGNAGMGGQSNVINPPTNIQQGGLFTATVSYAYGGSSNSAELTVQPTGNYTFASQCFRLVRNKVIQSGITNLPQGASNQLSFTNISYSNNDVLVVSFTFMANCAGRTSSSNPWTEITSNGTKYNLVDFGAAAGLPIPPPVSVETAVTVTQTANPVELVSGGKTRFQVEFKNLGKTVVYVSQISITQESGITFFTTTQQSEIDPFNSTISPTIGASGNILWRGIPQITYQIPPSGTTGIGNPGVLTLIYTATLTNIAGFYDNTVTAQIGNTRTAPVTATVKVSAPTAVEVSAFDAAPHGHGVWLTWETAQEIDSAGFYIYRRSYPGGGWERLNGEMIQAEQPGSLIGAEYGLLDPNLPLGQPFEYRLEVIHTSGEISEAGLAGPVTVVAKTYLPLIIK
jgi:hypothetical protein